MIRPRRGPPLPMRDWGLGAAHRYACLAGEHLLLIPKRDIGGPPIGKIWAYIRDSILPGWFLGVTDGHSVKGGHEAADGGRWDLAS
jgi:hypothetical protein